MAKLKASGTVAARKRKTKDHKSKAGSSGKLKIGDDWNAIRIIALSQSNPLKAIAEFVENSIDAGARHVTITRFRQRREAYIRVVDDGEGVPLDENGKPNFRYVATHICDSIKRQIKAQGQSGIQGEFGIGLLSFWTVGESLSMICPGCDGKPYEMRMVKGDPNFTVVSRRVLISEPGTKLTVGPLLSGIRNMSGEKLQWYLASELRDRIRKSGVEIRIIDRLARAEYTVTPREFDGQLLHHLPITTTTLGDVYVEIYLAEPQAERAPSLCRSGTRVLARMTDLEIFDKPPWNSGYFAGVIDAPFLNLTPGTRLGVIHDERLRALIDSLADLETALNEIVEEQKRMASETANRNTLKAIRKAFREALMILPEEEYDWFDIYQLNDGKPSRRSRRALSKSESTPYPASGNGATDQLREAAHVAADSQAVSPTESEASDTKQVKFYEHPGPLYSARITPTTCTMSVGSTRNFRVISRDRERRTVIDDLHFDWQLTDGTAELGGPDRDTIALTAPAEPQLVKLMVTVAQYGHGRGADVESPDNGQPSGDIESADQAVRTVQAEAIITVTDSLLPEPREASPRRGLPEYTFEKQPGQLWRSRFDTEANLIVINSGHRDFVYAARNKALKLRYICRLFGKELVLQNFPGLSSEQLLERLIELGLYTEENLR